MFLVYLQQPTPRPSHANFASYVSKSPSTITNYASRFSWTQRAEAYDAEARLAAIRDRAESGAASIPVDLTRDHIRALHIMRTLGLTRLQRALDTGELITVKEAATLVCESIKLERCVMATIALAQTPEGEDVDVTPLTTEELRRLVYDLPLHEPMQ
jgi:hypothetical protein